MVTWYASHGYLATAIAYISGSVNADPFLKTVGSCTMLDHDWYTVCAWSKTYQGDYLLLNTFNTSSWPTKEMSGFKGNDPSWCRRRLHRQIWSESLWKALAESRIVGHSCSYWSDTETCKRYARSRTWMTEHSGVWRSRKRLSLVDKRLGAKKR